MSNFFRSYKTGFTHFSPYLFIDDSIWVVIVWQMKTENTHVLIPRLINVNIYKKYLHFFVLLSSHEEFSSQFEEYIQPISALNVRSREFKVLMVQGLLLKESELLSPSKGVNPEFHVSHNTGESVF